MTDREQGGVGSELVSLGGSRPLFPEEVRARVAAGGRLVRFEVCISAVLFTLRRQSRVYLTHSRRERYWRGLGYSLVSLLLGPWAVPGGLIYTPWSIWVNLTGGVDETGPVLAWLEGRYNPCGTTDRPTG